jgi:ubiquitin carboxyl-terminal hydrolase 4/11
MDCKKEGVNTVYDLYAVTNHFGSLNGGHYTAFGKSPDGNWNNFNDSNVSGAGPKIICSSSAYLLFYRRREDPGA